MQQTPFLSFNPNFPRLRYPVLTVMAALWFTVAAQGGGTVTSYTEAALRTALTGGGTVKFACNGTITLTSPIIISAADTVLDGTGHTVTISGNNAVQLFNVDYYTLSLVNLTLANGRSDNGGAIYNSGFVIASNCTLTGNNAVGGNGSGGSNGSDGGSFGGNGTAGSAGTTGNGGAIYNSGYKLSLSFCTFQNNKATGGNGGAGGNGGSGSSRGGDGGSGGNGAAGFGGAIYSETTLSITN